MIINGVLYLKCDDCGELLPESCFVETLEEYLCENCASGVNENDDRDDYGLEEGYYSTEGTPDRYVRPCKHQEA